MTSLKRFLIILFLISFGASISAQVAERGQSQGWNPSRTWVFAVGILEWQHEDSWDSFPKEGRKDAELMEFFSQAGVPRDQILFIKDKEATKERIGRLMARHLAKASEGDMLIFYFTGHGARDEETGTVYFANYDADGDDLVRTAWSVPSIFNSIERNFKGSHALLIADCCYSGALADEAVRRRRTSIAYAALTSSRSDSVSTAEWTFTETLLRGFRGNARIDRDKDGEIELSELARYENSRMRAVEGQATSFATTRDFPSDMIVADVASTTTARASSRVEVEWQGEWYPATVLEVRGARYRIHYLGYGSDWDEWVDASRLRVSTSSVIPAGRSWSFSESSASL
jgi:hypothetical protein